MSLAAEHACTVTTAPWPAAPLLEVTAACSCGTWLAAAPVNPTAPRFDPDALPTALRALHRDHQADVLLLGDLADAQLAAEWDAVLPVLLGAPTHPDTAQAG